MSTKKLAHFILPDHFNKLYTEEAVSSISLTREMADKLNELIDIINKFDDEDLTWKHEMEGTIRKGVIYMKDNLLNSLHDLLELYVENGLIDEKIEHELNKSNIKMDMLHVTPQMYGALGDGKNDDTSAILKAFNDNDNVYFPSGTYLVNEEFTFDKLVGIYGAGEKNTTLLYRPTKEGNFITATHKDGIKIEDITIKCEETELHCNGVVVARGGVEAPAWGGKIEANRVTVRGFHKAQIKVYAPFYCSGSDITVMGTGFKRNEENNNLCDGTSIGMSLIGYEEGVINTFGNVNNFTNCFFQNCKYGLHMTSCVGNEFTNCVFEPNFINVYLPSTKGSNGDNTRVRITNGWFEDYTNQSHPVFGAYCTYDIDEETGLTIEPRPRWNSNLELFNCAIHRSCPRDKTMGVFLNTSFGATPESFVEARENDKAFMQFNSNDGAIMRVSAKESYFMGQLASRYGFKYYNCLGDYSETNEETKMYCYTVENENEDLNDEFTYILPHTYIYTECTQSEIDIYLRCTGNFNVWYKVLMGGGNIVDVKIMNDEGLFGRDIEGQQVKGLKVIRENGEIKITMKAVNCEYARISLKKRTLTWQ